MLADKTSCISPCTSCFCTEASSVCNVLNGELISVKNLFTVHVCYGNFCRGNKEILRSRYFKRILLKLGKLTCSHHGISMHHEGRENLCIAVFFGMCVKIIVDNGSFKSCTDILINSEACTCDFCGCVGVENTQILTQIPMRLRLKAEILRLTELSDFYIILVCITVGNGIVGNIGNCEHHAVKLVLYFTHLGIKRFNLFGYFFHFGKNRGCILARLFHSRDFLCNLVLLCLKPLYLNQKSTSFIVCGNNRININVFLSSSKGSLNLFGFSSYKFKIQHLQNFLSYLKPYGQF